jgi:hypothetical protein
MTAPTSGTGRNVTLDNWFASYPLAKSLLDHKLTMVGTQSRKIKKNCHLSSSIPSEEAQ